MRCKPCFGWGALAGDAFDVPIVAAAGEVDVRDAVNQLDLAARAGLLTAVDGSITRLRFEHENVREAVEGSMTPIERAAGHAQVLDALMARRGDGGRRRRLNPCESRRRGSVRGRY